MTEDSPTNGFCPIHEQNFLALIENQFRPRLRLAARSYWLHALMSCRREDGKKGGVYLKRGQFFYSREGLSQTIYISPMQIRTLEEIFMAAEEIARETTNEYTLISILKFDSYVIDQNESNKRITNGQQTDNKRVTTNQTLNVKRVTTNTFVESDNDTQEKPEEQVALPGMENSTTTMPKLSPLEVWAEQAVDEFSAYRHATSHRKPEKRAKAVKTTLSVLTEDMKADPNPQARLSAILRYVGEGKSEGALFWQAYLKSPSVLQASSKTGGVRWEAIEARMEQEQRETSSPTQNGGQRNGKSSPLEFGRKLSAATGVPLGPEFAIGPNPSSPLLPEHGDPRVAGRTPVSPGKLDGMV